MRRVVVEHNAKGQVRGLRIRMWRGQWGLFESKDRKVPFMRSTSLKALMDYAYTPDV